MRNTQGFSEQYREVVREDKVVIEGKPKAPDYSLRIGGIRKFFVEAKKPAINIKEDIEPAFQIRRYSYTAKLPLAILTDFEELAIYDTRIKPHKTDKASTARIFYCTYENYKEQFKFIYNTFSKKAILKGSFDKYIEENKNKKGTSEVDKEFLKLIEWWREILARTIALRNKKLNIYNLNYAIQKIIDRLIFLRIAEDRHMETYNTLLNISNNKEIYKNLVKFFHKADDKYNSGLFKIEDWIDNLQIDENILYKIIHGLYYPECPYEFSVLPIEILGHIYEQFLGKTIRLTKSHQAKIEEKPEVRKAGGVYYTPQYIVDYIVENTVKEIIKDKSPKQIEKLSICDPACGSGSFLVGAYKYLLNYHHDYYTNNENLEKALKNENIYQANDTDFRLTIEEKQKILLNNIYGVDIDAQAVEVTKLSLLLKLLEGEVVQSQYDLFKHSDLKLLPDLSSNIKCGNSIIESDYYKDKNISLFDTEEMQKINTFDWKKEFIEVFSKGGFDIIISNPPYIPMETLEKEQKTYFQNKYPQLERKYDSSIVFILAMMFNLNNSGLLGFISSITWQTGENYGKLREYLFIKKGILKLINLPFNVFKNAYVDTGIYILSNKSPKEYLIYRFNKKEQNPDLSNIDYIKIPKDLILAPDYKIIFDPFVQNILHRLFNNNKFILLGDITSSTQGLSKSKFNQSQEPSNNNWYPFLFNGQVYRYVININNTSYVDLSDFRSLPQYYESRPKILIRRVINRQDRLMCTYFDKKLVFKKDINPFIITDINWDAKYILGILNSNFISFMYINTSSIATKDDFRQTTLAELRKIPIPIFNKGDKNHNKLILLVDHMLEIKSKGDMIKTDSDKKSYQKKIEILDKQIDDLVYKLYNLETDEIKIIENEFS